MDLTVFENTLFSWSRALFDYFESQREFKVPNYWNCNIQIVDKSFTIFLYSYYSILIEMLSTSNPSKVLYHELTDKEKIKILQVAEHLAGPEKKLIDTSKWLTSAHAATSLLPRAILSVLRQFRNDPGADGVLLLRNLPVVGENPLPPTPCIPNSVELVASVPASVITSVMLQLGEIIAFKNEKSGALVQNVVPVPGKETSQSNAGSVLLEFHVENAFHDNRPDYIGLLCIREDLTGEAKVS